MKRRLILSLLALHLGTGIAEAARKPPKALAWAIEALEADIDVADGAPAVTLLDEARVDLIGSGGRRRFRRRTVVKVLSADGRYESLQPIYYGQNSTLATFKAWTIRPDGSIEPFAKRDAVDVSLSTAAVYSDRRQKLLYLRNVGVGSAVAVEYVLDENKFFLQDQWLFQVTYPVVLSRYTVSMPAGWTCEARVLNHDAIEPTRDGNTLTWEARDLPWRDWEPDSAPIRDQVPRLALSFLPRGSWGDAEEFRSWKDVAAWYDSLVSTQTAAGDEIRAVVAELTEGATSEHQKIERIGRFVQDLRYVSISLGLSRYQPHAANEVFFNRYADCKDKTALMMTMLREAGIESHPLLVFTRDEGKVYAEFPSPLQFNHCIIAIPVAEKTTEDALIIHPDMGEVLVFDPTDDLTPVGDLPWTDQGTRALLAHPDHGGLVDLPVLPAESNRAERNWEIDLRKDGHATVRMVATYYGQYARVLRYQYGGKDDATRDSDLTESLARAVPGAKLEKVDFQGLGEGKEPLRIEAEVEVANFARRAGPLLLAEPMRMVRTYAPDTSEEKRLRPLMVPFRFLELDRVTLALPEGYHVSEPPEGSAGDGPLGSYEVVHHAEKSRWEVERRLTVNTLEVPPSEYPAARELLSAAHAAAGAVLVLERDGS